MTIHLDKWQKDVLKYDGDLLLCTGRRVGKTYILARKAIDYMAKHHKCPVIIVSLTEDQAMIILQMALQYARERWPHLLGRKGRQKPTLKTLHINNNKMIVRPVGNTGDAVRGFEGGILIIDEASRMPKRFWIASKPIILMTGGQIWMGSTPFGKEGYFWDRFNEAYNLKDPEARFKVFYMTSEDVVYNREISSSWTEMQKAKAIDILKKEQREMTQSEYAQEYLGKFVDDIQRFFEDELIEEVCKLKRGAREGKNYLGCDLARMGEDLSTFEVVTDDGSDVYKQVENEWTKKTYTTETERKIIEMAKKWKVKKIGIDAGAGTLGVSILDHLLETEVRHKVVALNNRQRAIDSDGKKKQKLFKEDMYNNMKALMQRGELLLLDDDEIKLSLSSIQYEYVNTPAGLTKLRIFGRDAHVTEGLIRAVWLAHKEKSLKLWAYY